MSEVKIKGYDELIKAFKRNPAIVKKETKNYFIRGLAAYKRVILGNPWKIGGSGGGVPRDTSELATGHTEKIQNWQASYGPSESKTPYAKYVHEGTYKMQDRPWLDYAIIKTKNEIRGLQDNMLKNIINNLAK